jgi:hypothetical protein
MHLIIFKLAAEIKGKYMNLEISGTLFKIMPEQTGVGKNGNWVKQDFIIETQDQFPKKVCCTVWGDKAQELKKFNEGDNLKVGINIESREFNGKWYTDIKAWKLDGQSASSSGNVSSKDEVPFPASPPAFLDEAEDGDLPF